ncbi:MAG: nucleotidyltransferase domain-containing protein [Betaproteobacteria bacterium]|nr:nucleotidyltransferase domain-containing protein [Betaproteobacteria bacterium]
MFRRKNRVTRVPTRRTLWRPSLSGLGTVVFDPGFPQTVGGTPVRSGNPLSRAQGAVRLALDHLSAALPDGARVIVFGSHAEGSARPDSDIDLFVIEPEVKDRAEEMIRLSALLGRQLIPADVVVMSGEMFVRQREIPNTLAWRVARQGVEYELYEL